MSKNHDSYSHRVPMSIAQRRTRKSHTSILAACPAPLVCVVLCSVFVYLGSVANADSDFVGCM